jgi:histidinol-phosphate aminotransferase
VLRTLSKLFGLAGLRLGYAVVDAELARFLNVVQEPFNVNRAALAAGRVCLSRTDLVEERRRAVAAARDLLCLRLVEAGVEPSPSQTNFVLVRVGGDDRALARTLAEEDGLLVRTGSEYGLDGYVRITVGPEELMERVAAAIGRAGRPLRGRKVARRP